jgi:hypothetical protein
VLEAAGPLGYQARVLGIACGNLQGNLMAVDTSGGNSAMDYTEHLRTYSRFVRLTASTIVLIVLVLLFLLSLVP